MSFIADRIKGCKQHVIEQSKKFRKEYAWYPRRLSSGKWVFREPVWVRYEYRIGYGVALYPHVEKTRKKLEVVDEEGYLFHRLSDKIDINNGPPKPPPTRIIKEGEIASCKKCGSSVKRNLFFKELGCRQPECENFYDG